MSTEPTPQYVREATQAPTPDPTAGVSKLPIEPLSVYYCLFAEDELLESRRPIYSNDRSIGRILVKSIPPPHTARSIARVLRQIEGFKASDTSQLFVPLSRSYPENDNTHIALSSHSIPGLSAQQPLGLVVQSQASLRSKATADNNLAKVTDIHEIDYVYYRLYSKEGALASKTSFKKDEPSLGRINILSIMPPQTMSSLQARIYGVEKLDGYTPYLYENIFSEKTISNGAMSFSGASHPGQKEDQPMAVICNPFELSTMSPRVLRPLQLRHQERTKSPNVFFAPSTKSGEQEKRVASHYIYYRVYRKGGPTGSNYAIYNDDQSICRVEVKSITPPHTAGSLRQNLHKFESTPSTNSRLLISIWSQEFCDDSYRLDLSGDTYPGLSEHDPVVLSLDLVGGMNSKVLDEQMMQVSGAPPKVAFAHYRLFSEDGEFASKRSFDKEDPPLGRINVLTLRPPHTVNSVKMCIACQEGLTSVTDEMPNVQLFANLFSRDPMGDGPILFYEGAYPGCEEGEPIALVYKKDGGA